MNRLLREPDAFGPARPTDLVPLVFDGTGSLYSAAGFNRMLASGAAFPTDEVLFVDYATFAEVTRGSSERGESYARLYADGQFHAAPQGESAAEGARQRPLRYYDPYECGKEIECPLNNIIIGGGGGGTGVPGQPSRPLSDVSAVVSASPNWPSLWKGDVISGEKDCGSSSGTGCSSSSGGSSSGPSNLGHSLLITKLNNNGQWGGDFTSASTLSMEAVGDRPNPADEVVERQAYTWFNSTNLEYALVLYHKMATWAERDQTIALARAQDPDPYDALTMKNNWDEWYCSKLIYATYKNTTGDDLDPNWGFFVFPSDLENSGHLITTYFYRHG